MKTLMQFLMEQEKDKEKDSEKSVEDTSKEEETKEEDTEEEDSDEKDTEEEDTEEESSDEDKVDMNGFIVLKPEFLDKENELRNRLEEEGWKVVGEQEKKLSENEAKDFYKEKEKEPYFDDLIEYMTSDKSKCFMLWKEDSANPLEEIRTLKEKLRQEWSEDDMKNVLHSSDSWDAMEKELSIFLHEEDEEDTSEEDDEESDDKDTSGEDTEETDKESEESEDDGSESEDESEEEEDLGL